jgi:quercetin dioxygenase-like cupin family protein
MTMSANPTALEYPPVPPDDLDRRLAVARPDSDSTLPHVGLVGDTYTILLKGSDTGGRYTLIDMHVPPGGGPPPHRHDFEEMFSVLEGEIEITFRGEVLVARAGETVNVPANAPHSFRNASAAPARMLCMCSPAGQEELFMEVGLPSPRAPRRRRRWTPRPRRRSSRRPWRSRPSTGRSSSSRSRAGPAAIPLPRARRT